MIDFEPQDLVRMDQWPLGWRFADGRRGHVAESLARIRPLSSSRAAALADMALELEARTTTVDTTFRSDDSPSIVRDRLCALPPTPAAAILLSWSPQIAATTDWEMFLACWDDFCYPAADDVTIWPIDGTWVLSYRHYEIFQFRPAVPSTLIAEMGGVL